MIRRAIQDCSGLLDQSLLTLTSLQEDLTIQQVEIEVQGLQQAYETTQGAMQIVTIMYRLAKMKEIRALKAQVDATRKKEAVLKERIQPWLDKSFLVSTTIEGKLAYMQAVGDCK